jgi:myo-inositol-1-phosphate synthase
MSIKIGIIGVGNCASALIQGLTYYKVHPAAPGCIHPKLANYTAESIQPVFAVDIDQRKVGCSLKEALFAPPNVTPHIVNPEIPDVQVCMGEVLDGVSPAFQSLPTDRRIEPASRAPDDLPSLLQQSGTEILLNFLPVGSIKATAYYMELALSCGIHVINCIPEFIASNTKWERKFREKGLICIGDDIRSQLGATMVHQTLARLFEDRGIQLKQSYQLNVGGNTDFANMLDRTRLHSKKISKTNAVNAYLKNPLDSTHLTIGPSDYVPYLEDEKICFLRLEGEGFLQNKIQAEIRLSVVDSPNSAGIVMDVIRLTKIAIDKGLKGAILPICNFGMKSPPPPGGGVTDESIQKLLEF